MESQTALKIFEELEEIIRFFKDQKYPLIEVYIANFKSQEMEFLALLLNAVRPNTVVPKECEDLKMQEFRKLILSTFKLGYYDRRAGIIKFLKRHCDQPTYHELSHLLSTQEWWDDH